MNCDLLCDVIYSMDIEKLREILAEHVMRWHKSTEYPNMLVTEGGSLIPEKQWLPDKNIMQAMALVDRYTTDLGFELERDWDGRWYSMLKTKRWHLDDRCMVVASSNSKEKAICYVIMLGLIAGFRKMDANETDADNTKGDGE